MEFPRIVAYGDAFEGVETVVPESWIRNHTRDRTPKDHRIPCIRLGRYVRFEWGSVRLTEWLAKHQG